MLYGRVKEVYESDASRITGKAVKVFIPESIEDVVTAVNFAKERGLKITPRGGGTALTGAAVPKNSIVIDLSRLRGIEGVKSSSIVALAGTPLVEVMEAAENQGRLFPVKPASFRVATVGGAIATNAAGIRAKRFGRTCNWVKRLWVVTGEGRLQVVSGDEVKNFCGSEGAFGIIVKAELKLTEKPEAVSSDIFLPNNYREAQKVIEELLDCKDVVAIELASDVFFQVVYGKKRIELLVEYFSERGKITGNTYEAVWKRREGYAPAVMAKGYTFIEDPKVPVRALAEFFEFLSQKRIPAFSHAAVGIVHPFFKNIRTAESVLKKALELGGEITGEHGYGILKGRYAPESFERLKKRYDPYGLFEAGPRKMPYNLGSFECAFCGLCKYYCPVVVVTGLEDFSPRAKLNFLEKYREIAMLCSLCKACEENCPVKAKVTEKIIKIRHEMKKELLKNPAIEKMVKNVLTTGNVFGGKRPGKEELFCC